MTKKSGITDYTFEGTHSENYTGSDIRTKTIVVLSNDEEKKTG